MLRLSTATAVFAVVTAAWTFPLIANFSSSLALPSLYATDAGLRARGLDSLPESFEHPRTDEAGCLSKQPLAVPVRNDQLLSVWGAARNSSAIASGQPGRLLDNGMCHPTPRAAFLGEHMIELGILALPAHLLGANPVATYNFACLLMFVIAGATMFALVDHWTGCWSAALVAGLLFAFHPSRTGDIMHPAVIGLHWLPLVLLAFERLLAHGRRTDGMLLALAACLQVLVGAYPLLILACFAGPYGLTRLLQNRHSLDGRRLLWLGAATGAAVSVAGLLLYTYAESGAAWQTFRPRTPMLMAYADLLPGATASVGAVVVLLAAGILLPRGGEKTVSSKAVAAGILACLLFAGHGRAWPGGPELPSLYGPLAAKLDFLTTIRVPSAIRMGVYLGMALLAGLGLARALARLGPRGRRALATLAVAAVLLETFHPTLSASVYGHSPALELRNVSPEPELLEAYRVFDAYDSSAREAILDLPHRGTALAAAMEMPFYTYLSASHRRPFAACYNSYIPPSFFSVAAMAADLPSERALTELAAAGFRNLVVHHDSARPSLAPALAGHRGVELLYTSKLASALRVVRQPATHSDTNRLLPGSVVIPPALERARWVRQAVGVEIHNNSDETWALPHPIRPLVAKVRWWPAGRRGTPSWLQHRLLLPLALAPGAMREVRLDLSPLPPAGSYRIDIEVPELGWRLIPSGEVRVVE